MLLTTLEKCSHLLSVIAEFEIPDAALAAITSDAYQAAFALLGNVERDVRVIEVLD